MPDAIAPQDELDVLVTTLAPSYRKAGISVDQARRVDAVDRLLLLIFVEAGATPEGAAVLIQHLNERASYTGPDATAACVAGLRAQEDAHTSPEELLHALRAYGGGELNAYVSARQRGASAANLTEWAPPQQWSGHSLLPAIAHALTLATVDEVDAAIQADIPLTEYGHARFYWDHSVIMSVPAETVEHLARVRPTQATAEQAVAMTRAGLDGSAWLKLQRRDHASHHTPDEVQRLLALGINGLRLDRYAELIRDGFTPEQAEHIATTFGDYLLLMILCAGSNGATTEDVLKVLDLHPSVPEADLTIRIEALQQPAKA